MKKLLIRTIAAAAIASIAIARPELQVYESDDYAERYEGTAERMKYKGDTWEKVIEWSPETLARWEMERREARTLTVLVLVGLVCFGFVIAALPGGIRSLIDEVKRRRAMKKTTWNTYWIERATHDVTNGQRDADGCHYHQVRKTRSGLWQKRICQVNYDGKKRLLAYGPVEPIDEKEGEAKFVMTQPSIKKRETVVPTYTPQEGATDEEEAELDRLVERYSKGAF